MKKLMLLFVLFAAMSVNAQSENKVAELMAKHWVSSGTFSFGFDRAGMHTRSYSLRSGYEVLPKFVPFYQLETQIGLYHKGQEKDYFNTVNMGLGARYNLIPQIGVHGLWATSLGNRGWKYNLYEVGVTLKGSRKQSQTLGFGYRFVDSRTKGIDDYKGFFVSVGFCL